MEKKYLISTIVVLAIVLVLAASLTLTQPESQNTIQIGYTPIMSNLPLFVAVENGYFEEEGINVELVKFDSPNQLNDALLQGQIDATCPGMALGIFAISDYKNPGKIKVFNILAGNSEVPAAQILVHKDSDIQTISDLKGKKLGIFGGTIQWTTITKNYLAKNGLEAYGDVELVELAPGLHVQTLAAKQIDALLALDPMRTVALEQGIARVLDVDPIERTVNNPSWIGAGAINVAYAENNSQIAEKYLAALKRGIEFSEQNKSEAIKVLPKYTPVTVELAQKLPLLQTKTCDEITDEDLQGMQNFYNLFTEQGVVDGIIDAKAALYCSS